MEKILNSQKKQLNKKTYTDNHIADGCLLLLDYKFH